MPVDEIAEFTTQGAKPVVCQRCYTSFKTGTELFFMHDTKAGPGKHICEGCHQYYLRKMQATKNTGQLLFMFLIIKYINDNTATRTQPDPSGTSYDTTQPSADSFGTSYDQQSEYTKGCCGSSETGFKFSNYNFLRHQ